MKIKKFSFNLFAALAGVSSACLIAWAISHWTSFPFWGTFAIVILTMVVNGFIADYEDELPGGFNNPLPPKEEKKEPIQPPQTTIGSSAPDRV